MNQSFDKKGYVTIATGAERYYKLAANLLMSYRMFASKGLPFAIIADRENQYTKLFDYTILINDAENSFNDKLKLYREAPFDETIFIDADCLAYGDLDSWWDVFAEGGDFAPFGYAWRDLNSGRGWFVPSGMKEFSKDLTFIPDFNGGVYYLRKTPTCGRVFEIANYCAKHYSEYNFNGFLKPADEPVLALGMAVCDIEPVHMDGELIFAPANKDLDADISEPRAVYHKDENRIYCPKLIHFSNYKTQLGFYRNEVAKLKRLVAGGNKSIGIYKVIDHLRLWFFTACDIIPYTKRVIRKLKRIMKK